MVFILKTARSVSTSTQHKTPSTISPITISATVEVMLLFCCRTAVSDYTAEVAASQVAAVCGNAGHFT